MGDLFACGFGDAGQLGIGVNEIEKSIPVLVKTNSNIEDVCAGGLHSLYLTSCGKVYSFGCNDDFALGRDTSNDETSEFIPSFVELPDKVRKISAGDSHSACLLNNGSVWGWGSFRDSSGCMGFSEKGSAEIPLQIKFEKKAVDIASGANHLVIQLNDGKVYTLGCGEQGQLGRLAERSSSRTSRQGKNGVWIPGLVYLQNKPITVEKIWTTPYGTFLKQYNSSKIFAFGLNNYKQLGGSSANLNIEFFPCLTKLKDVKNIAGRLNSWPYISYFETINMTFYSFYVFRW
jgi:regulator of chromosome condensation